MGACMSDLSPEQQEMYEANLKKWSRIYEKDLTTMKLTPAETKRLFEPFQDMDLQGTGKLNELKWYRYMTPSILRPDEDPTAKLLKAAGSKLNLLGSSSSKVSPEQGGDAEEGKADAAGAAADEAPGPLPPGTPTSHKSSTSPLSSPPPLSPSPSMRRGMSGKGMLVSGKSTDSIASTGSDKANPPRTKRKYARRLFRVFAREGRGECDFGEFAASALELLPPLLHCLIRFAFLIYDTDGSGSLSAGKWTGLSEINPDEVVALAQEVAATLPAKKKSRKGEAATLAAELSVDAAVLKAVSKELLAGPARTQGALGEAEAARNVFETEFGRFALRNPAVLFPAARLQAALRMRLGGNQFFREIALRRLRLASLWSGSGLTAADSALSDANKWTSSLRDMVIKGKRKDNADLVHSAVKALSLGGWTQPDDLPAEEKSNGAAGEGGAGGKPALKRGRSKKSVSEGEGVAPGGGPASVEIASAAELAAVRAQFAAAFGDFSKLRRA